MRTEKRERGAPGWGPYTEGCWGEGPWNNEPDRAQWVDEATGLDCLAVRNMGGGFWCGYVGVPKGHPAYGKGHDDVRTHDDEYLSAHGGLTYSNTCAGEICHTPEPGRPDNVWWLGFDCAHSGDFMPHNNSYVGHPTMGKFYPKFYKHGEALKYVQLDFLHPVYRTFEYVQDQCRSLAEQLKAME